MLIIIWPFELSELCRLGIGYAFIRVNIFMLNSEIIPALGTRPACMLPQSLYSFNYRPRQ